MSNKRYHRAGKVLIPDVLAKIEEFYNKGHRYKIVINGYRVNVNSNRLKTFIHSQTCPCCNLEASHFAIEKTLRKGDEDFPLNKKGYHLNLYGINEKGEEILFTHDHTLARALGGADALDNTVTMCSPCNGHKGQLEGRIKSTKSELYKEILREEIEKFLKTGVKYTPPNPEAELDINPTSKNTLKKIERASLKKALSKSISRPDSLTDDEKSLLKKHYENKEKQSFYISQKKNDTLNETLSFRPPKF